MKFKMLNTTPGSNDGKVVTVFNAGTIYECPEEISESLVEVFTGINVGAKYIEPVAPVEKAIHVAPLNKAIKSIPKRKKK